MNKQITYVAVAAVGIVAIATWSMGQSPKGPPATKSPLSSSPSGESGAEILPKSKLPSGTFSSGSIPSGPTRGNLLKGAGPSTAPTTASSNREDLDSSLSPFRGASSARGDSLPGSSPPGSATPSGTSIRIDHALVTSLDPIKLPARDAGAIREITVKKGNEVKVADVLGQLDDRESLAKLKVAEQERNAAQIQAESDAQIDAAVKGEKVTMENLKANEKIREKNPGALSDFDMRRSTFEWERSVAQILVARMEKEVAKATQYAKEAQIEAANVEIERRKIVAPIDGFVNEVYRHKGEWCQPGDPVLELVRMDRLEIEGFVYAADASPSKVLGKPVEVVVQLAGGESYKASSKITFASPVLEGSGRIRQFRVSTEIDNKRVAGEAGQQHWLIQPGTEAEMTIQLSPPAPKPVIAPKTISPAGTKGGLPGSKSGLPGSKSGLPGSKVEALKPAVPDLGGKSSAKTSANDEKKSETKGDSKSATKSETKSDANASDKAAKSEPKSDKTGDSKNADAAKDSSKSGESTKPAEKNGKEPTKSSTIKL